MKHKIKNFISAACMIAVLISANGCSNKIYPAGYTETIGIHDIGAYNTIDVSSAISVHISDKYDYISIESDANILPYVIVETDGNELEIKYTDNLNIKDWDSTTHIYIPSDGITGIEASGASVVESDTELSAEDFSIEASGASRIHMDIMAGTARINMSGASSLSGRMTISGTADINLSGASQALMDGICPLCRISLSGASLFKGMKDFGYRTNILKGELSGASQAHVFCDGLLSCSLSGASHIIYEGNAENKCNTSGGSSVTKK